MDSELESKLRRLTRMSFQDIYANAYASAEVWQAAGKTEFMVGEWSFKLGESNAGTLQLICVGIETFGRVLLGYTNDRGKSEKAFACFLRLFFPATYQAKAKEIYYSYRCGFLHSHYLGFGSKQEGFYPTRGMRLLHDRHLEYSNLAGDTASTQKNQDCFRLIINIDVLLSDFRGAVEKYVEAVKNSETLTLDGTLIDVANNAQLALKEFPQEDADLLAVQKVSLNPLVFGSSTPMATQTSYPPSKKEGLQ